MFSNQADGGPPPHEIMHNWALALNPSLGFLDGTGHYLSNSDAARIMDAGNNPARAVIEFAPDADFAVPGDIVSNGNGTFRFVRRLGPNNG